jgi:hypothetical protein
MAPFAAPSGTRSSKPCAARGTFGHPSTVYRYERPGVVRGQVTNRRSRRGMGYLAAAGVAVALAASACSSSNGSGLAKATQTGVVTTTADATPDVPPPTTDDSQVALRQLLSAISTDKAQLAQYRLDLNALCGAGLESNGCWTALHYSETVGTDVMKNVGPFSPGPAEATDLFNSTLGTALALNTMNGSWCAPDRDFITCYSHVIGTTQRLTQQFAGWDPYYAPQ